jgi:hypothetical protein
MLENRKLPRKKMVLPVKVTIDKATYLAHTVDTLACWDHERKIAHSPQCLLSMVKTSVLARGG